MPSTPAIARQIDLLEELLQPWRATIGEEYQGYRNHVYRMVHFSLALAGDPASEERQKILVAAAYHDIGIWIEDTLDYLDPSVPPALEYLDREGLGAWSDEVETMIREHHKLRPYRGRYPLVETFRRGDLADFSLGLIRSGIPNEYIQAVKKRFPNAGFHAALVRRELRWLTAHPLNPVPMMKW